jgi:hypothetical protein
MHIYDDVLCMVAVSVKMMCCCDMWNEEIIHSNCWEWWDSGDYIILIFFYVHAFPNNILWLDFSPLSCCGIYGVCTRGLQILRTKRSSCGTPSRIRRKLSSVNFILTMIRYVVEYELWYVTPWVEVDV